MKKFIAVCIVGFALSTAAVFADHPGGLGIGLQGGWSGGVGGGLSLKVPSLPVFWTIDASFSNGIGLGVAGDYYIFDQDFAKGLGWYLGVGGFGYIGLYDPLGLAAGARVPIGLSWRPIDLLEIYLQVVPSIGLQVLPKIDLWPNFFGGNLGIRLWF
jgi:hypothetical protein